MYIVGGMIKNGATQQTVVTGCAAQRDLLTGQHYKRGGTGVAERLYTYNALGIPTTRRTARQGTVRHDAFGYNERSELTSAALGSAPYAYAYDNIDNRKTAQEDAEAVTYAANELNQYTDITTGEEDFIPEYDRDGNQTRIRTSTGIWTANYNAQNRPVRFTRENADGTRTVITSAYDYMGRRAWKKVETIAPNPETGEETATVTLHQRDIYRGYLQVAACDLTRGGHPCLWLITWDPTQPTATRPLGIQKDGTWYCYGWDLTKNVCEVFGQAGYIRTTYAYTPYGLVTEEGDIAQPLQWSSEYADLELGLVYYNYRYYNPTDGRWIRRDKKLFPYLYLYCKNNSYSMIDVLGDKETNISLLLYYLSLFRNRNYYDTDDFGFTEKIKEIINRDIIPKVIWQINNIVRDLIEKQRKCYGVNKTIYKTSNSYDFSSVLWALGSGTVSTQSDITYSWKKLFCTRKIITTGFSWSALTRIEYSDIFRDIFDIEEIMGFPIEVGNDFYYRHIWLDSIYGEGVALIMI